MRMRPVAICVALSLIAALPLRSQETEDIQDFDELDLESLLDVVFTASKHQQSIFWSPQPATVFTREDIQTSGADNLADLLRRVPGFDVYELKPSFPLVGARAMTDDSNNLVLVLVDGREAMIELTGYPLWVAMSFDLEEVERVEVIRGPGSTLYGANAFAAVVSITTLADRPANNADVVLSGGERGLYRFFGRVRDFYGLGGGRLSFGAGGGVQGRRSASDPADRTLAIHRAHGYLRYQKGDDLYLSLHAGSVGGDGLVYVYAGDERITGALNYWVMGKSELALLDAVRLRAQLYYTRFQCDLHMRSNISAYDVWIADFPDFSWDSQTVDGQLQLDVHVLEDFLLIGGGYVHYTALDHQNLIVSSNTEFRGAVFAHAQWTPLEALQLTGGLRLDLNDFSEPALSPRAVAVYRPWPDHAFRLGYAQAFRKPSHYESRVHLDIRRYNPAMPEVVAMLAEQLGNEDLRNEEVHSIEAGWRGRFLDESLRVSVDLFYSLYRDAICIVSDIPLRLGVPDLQNSTLQYRNDPDGLDALGAEAEITWRLGGSWSLWSSMGIRHVTDRGEGGDRGESEPALRVNLGGRFLPENGWLVDLACHYVSAFTVRIVDPSSMLDPPRPVDLGNRVLLIGRLGYRTETQRGRNLELGLKLRAPLGASFREYAGMPRPLLMPSDSESDFGGEMFVRVVSLYLEGSF
jgi:outer membrane receptor protein involved in Fe transport